MPRFATLAVVLLALGAPAATAQWLVGVTAGSQRFGSVAADTASGSRWAGITSSTVLGGRIERRFTRVAVAIDIAYGRAGFAVEDAEFALVAKDVFRLWEIAPEIGVRVAGADTATSVWLRAGPVLDIWMADGADTRVRAGVAAGASLVFPLGPRVSGEFGVRGGVTPSPFDEVELAPGFEPRPAWRGTVIVGARYRL